jgi:hypothetical protein
LASHFTPRGVGGLLPVGGRVLIGVGLGVLDVVHARYTDEAGTVFKKIKASGCGPGHACLGLVQDGSPTRRASMGGAGASLGGCFAVVGGRRGAHQGPAGKARREDRERSHTTHRPTRHVNTCMY